MKLYIIGCRFLFILFSLSITIYPVRAQSPVITNAHVENIAEGFSFVEGPVWKDGTGILFSDIPANTVYLWTPESGAIVYLSPSGNSNGLSFDLQNRLLLAQHGKRQIARIEPGGSETSIASHYHGKRLNSPNDIVVKSDGSIFFTDPPYGISPGQEELSFSGIYRISPSDSLQLLDTTLYRPNGIAFSPDESILYVGDAEARIIYIWDVVNDSILANKRQFAFMNASGAVDGMKVDEAGYLYASGPFGIWVFKPDGTVIDTIPVPGQTTNCNWGDEDRKALYVTSGSALYRITNQSTTGMFAPEDDFSSGKSVHLLNNYPNPFNTTTLITFQLSETERVMLSICNSLGETIITLIDKIVYKGYNSILWNAQNLSSGIYYVILTTGENTDIHKCILQK
jgi:gluconolactonase